jgi:RNA polymerase sigma-70 factor (ECF subfamily)
VSPNPAQRDQMGETVNLPSHWSVSVVNERNGSSGTDDGATGPATPRAARPLPRRRPPSSTSEHRHVFAPPTTPAPAKPTSRERDDDVVVTWAGSASPGLAGTILTGEHRLGPIPLAGDAPAPAPQAPEAPRAKAAPAPETPAPPPVTPPIHELADPYGVPVIDLDAPPPHTPAPVRPAPAPAPPSPPRVDPTPSGTWPVVTSGLRPDAPVPDVARITAEHPALKATEGPGTVAMVTAEHVALAVAGDAFDTFYRSEKPRVVAVVSSLTGDRAAAEDIVQEAFATAMRRWATVSAYERPGDWVKRVAVNRAISRFRRRQSETRALTRLVGRDGDDDSIAGPLGASEAWDDDPLWAAVRKLPRRQAQAVVLVYVDDLSLERVAEILECSVGSVKTHLHRARQRLAAELGQAMPPAAGEGASDGRR